MSELLRVAVGVEVQSPIYGVGDWVRTQDGRLIEVVKLPSIGQACEWGAQEIRQPSGNVWRVTP